MSGSPPAGVSKDSIVTPKTVPWLAVVTFPIKATPAPSLPIMSPAVPPQFNPVRSIIIDVFTILTFVVTSLLSLST